MLHRRTLRVPSARVVALRPLLLAGAAFGVFGMAPTAAAQDRFTPPMGDWSLQPATPTPSPSPTASPSPAPTPAPAPAPTARPPVVVAPTPAPTRAPAPAPAANGAPQPAPAPVPSPSAAPVTTDAPPPAVEPTLPPVAPPAPGVAPEPALPLAEPEAPARSGLPWLVGGLVVLLGGAGGYWWRRRRAPAGAADAAEPEIVPAPLPDEAPAVRPAPAMPRRGEVPRASPLVKRVPEEVRPPANQPGSAPLPLAAAPAAKQPEPARREPGSQGSAPGGGLSVPAPQMTVSPAGLITTPPPALRRVRPIPDPSVPPPTPIEFTLSPLELGLVDDELALEFELWIQNPNEVAIDHVLVATSLLTAGPQIEAQIDRFFTRRDGVELDEGMPMDAEDAQRVTARVALPKRQIHTLTNAKRPYCVPMLVVDAQYRWATGHLARKSVALILGAATPGQEKLAPVFLDDGTQPTGPIGVRVHRVVHPSIN